MTLKKLFFTLLFACCVVTIYAQTSTEFAKAILIDNTDVQDPIFEKINDENLNKLYAIQTQNSLFYDWDSKDHTVKFALNNKFTEKPSEVIVFVKPVGRFDINPPFKLDRDTTGKITRAYFLLSKEVKYFCKHVDARTSKVISNKVFYLVKKGQAQLELPYIEKEFGGDPKDVLKSSSAKYEELLTRLRIKYAQKIKDTYLNDYYNQAKFINFSSIILGSSQKSFEVIKPTGVIEKKTKSIKFKGGIHDNIIMKDYYNVLIKKEIEGYHYYDDVTTVEVTEIGENESTASTELFSSKALSDALSSDNQLLLVHISNNQIINKINSKNDVPLINIAIKKNCLFCNVALESTIYDCPVFTLIERNAPELKYFASLTKDERFIDYSVEDLQGKLLGYEILLVTDNENFDVIETKTNKILGSFKKSYLLGNNPEPELSISQSNIQRFLSSYNSDIYKVEWIKTLDEKKEKINEVLVYHPAGMDRYMEYNFYTLITESVDGEKIDRKNKIGSGRIGKSYSPNISVLKVKSGEKEIYQAKTNNEKIIIEVSDKSFN